MLLKIQIFYANEMDRFGYGRKTFQYENNGNEPIIHFVNGVKRHDEYINSFDIYDDLPKKFTERFILDNFHKIESKIRILFIFGPLREIKIAVWWKSCRGKKCLNTAVVGLNVINKNSVIHFTAHELGHSFGLHHNKIDLALMKHNIPNNLSNTLDKRFLLEEEAKILSIHQYFSIDDTYDINIINKLPILWSSIKTN